MGAASTEYGTLLGMELVSVGMEWPAMTGTVAVTLEHLVDMMVAANDDPLISAPRVKIGHYPAQPLEDGWGELGDWDPFWDGEPAFGSIVNLRLSRSGAKLIGDAINVPAWLADAAPSAWPTRSCEFVWDVETEGGKRYSAVLTACALGSWQQAIKDLADLQGALAGDERMVSV